MASIEVSLSTTPRRKKNGSIGSGRGPASLANEASCKDHVTKEMETMRSALRDKENVIQSLKGQLSSTSLSRLSASYLRAANSGSRQPQPQPPLTDKEKRSAEERLHRLKQEMDNKRLAIKNLKMALDRLDITDNIDVRIQQAELEYQLGREELNLLTFLEESRNIQACLEEAEQNKFRGDASTIYSCVSGGLQVTLHAVELNYDAKSPRFGAGLRENSPGLWVEWAAEDSAMEKGDRILEVNGKIVLTKTKEDLMRLLSVTPDPALLVVLRLRSSHFSDYREELLTLRVRAEEAERVQDTYRTDNVRLTHRISYLEEQVSELISDKCLEDVVSVTQSPIVTSSDRPVPSSPKVNPVQVYQKGQVTALVANLPGLEVGSQSPLIDAKHSLPIKSKPQPPSRNQDRIVRLEVGPNPNYMRPTASSSKPNNPRRNLDSPSVRSGDVSSDYSTTRHYEKYNNHLPSARSSNSLDIFDIQSPPMKNMKVQKSRHPDEISADNLAVIEAKKAQKKYSKSQQRLECTEKYPDYKSGRSDLDYISGSSSNLYRIHNHKVDARSVKSLDFDSEPNYTPHKSRDHYQYVRNDNNCRVHATGEYNGRSESTNRVKAHHDAEKISSRSQNRQKMLEYGSDTSNLTTNSDYPNTGSHKPQRPTPPKKPLRLSLHKATSLQCVNTPLIIPDGLRKPTKRKHKGEAPPLPVLTGDNPPMQPPRTPSRVESCQSALRWPSPSVALHQLRMSSKYSAGPGEKWC